MPLSSDSNNSQQRRNTLSAARIIGLTAVAILCWLLTTIAQLEKYLSIRLASVTALTGSIGVVVLILTLIKLNRSRRDLPRWSLPVLYILLAASFAVIYPKAQLHLHGGGSDREDALRVEIVALTHHQYPYDARTFAGNAPTPLPGAMLLATPFFLLGRVAFQNLFWAAIFLLFLSRFFTHRTTGVAFVLLFLVTALENLNDFDVGGDYITNIMYVAVTVFLVSHTVDSSTPPWQTVATFALLGLALSSRVIYVVALPPIFAFVRQRANARRAVACLALTVAVAFLVTLPVFAPHPLQRLLLQLHQNADKLEYLPRFLRGATLPMAGLLIAFASFFVRMSLDRVYLIIGLATLAMLGPTMLAVVVKQGGLVTRLTTDLEYLAVPALFIALWLFSRFDRTAVLHSN